MAIDNEIRLLRVTLEKKRADLRRRLEEGAEVEDGPLKSFAPRIARMQRRKARRKVIAPKRISRFGSVMKKIAFAISITMLVQGD